MPVGPWSDSISNIITRWCQNVKMMHVKRVLPCSLRKSGAHWEIAGKKCCATWKSIACTGCGDCGTKAKLLFRPCLHRKVNRWWMEWQMWADPNRIKIEHIRNGPSISIRGTVGAGESRLCVKCQYNIIKPDGTSARKLPFAAARNSQPSHAATAPQLTRTKWPRILHSAVRHFFLILNN
jgi:hypothetical protein